MPESYKTSTERANSGIDDALFLGSKLCDYLAEYNDFLTKDQHTDMARAMGQLYAIGGRKKR